MTPINTRKPADKVTSIENPTTHLPAEYRFQWQLGADTFGFVIQCIHQQTGLSYVIKLCNYVHYVSICNEIRASHKFGSQHTNIVVFVHASPSCCLVMEIYETDLQQRLTVSPLVSDPRKFTTDIAVELKFMHGKGLIYHNVLISWGVTKLCDFGLTVPSFNVGIITDHRIRRHYRIHGIRDLAGSGSRFNG